MFCFNRNEVMIDLGCSNDWSGLRSWLIGIQVMIDWELGHDLIWFEVIIYLNGSHD
jgi:hypothetical protein